MFNGIPATARSTKSRSLRNRALSFLSDGVHVSVVRLTKLIRVPALTPMTVRVRCDATGLSFLDPRPSCAARQGVRMTSGGVELDTRKESDVIVANFT